MQKQILTVLTCYVMLLIGCGQQEIAENTSELRIISLSPNLTEIIFSLGLEHNIVGVTDYCKYPPEAAQKPHVGGVLNPNYEVMLSLRPTLVFGLPSHEAMRGRFKAIGAELIIVRNETIQDVLDSLVAIGSATGKEHKSQVMVEGINTKINKHRGLGASSLKVLIIVGRTPGALQQIYAVGKGTFLDELVSIAGGVNVLEESLGNYPIISKETIIAANPDVIIDASFGTVLTEEVIQKEKAVWEGLGSITAVKEKRIFIINDPHLTIPGVHIPEQIEYLAQIIQDKQGK